MTEFIRALVAAGPVPAREAEKQIRAEFENVPKTTMFKARKRAGVISRKAGMGGGWEWSLPEDSPEGSQDSPVSEAGTFETFGEPSSTGPGPDDVEDEALALLTEQLGATVLQDGVTP